MEITIRITGTAPLLMHNNTLVDPLAEATKKFARVNKKRVKTDEDHVAVRRMQFESSLYMDPKVGPYMPGANIAKSLFEGAKLRRSGPKVKGGLIVMSPVNRLEYDGPRDVSGLWNDLRFRLTIPCKVPPRTGSTVINCRPIFPEWSCVATALVNPTVLSKDDLEEIVQEAGQMIGVGDWRPWHGRFTAEVA